MGECKRNTCANVTTYYDWERQANLIIDSPDIARAEGALWDLELGNRHSYYFHPTVRKCKFIGFPVGVLRQDWLANATFLGSSWRAGRPVLGWTKADFIDFYADADDCSPVSWYFHGMQTSFDTLEYFEGEAVPDVDFFKPPDYCSNKTEDRLQWVTKTALV